MAEIPYQTIAIGVDNSADSLAAEEVGTYLAHRLGASITGCHIYSGHLHRIRFLALEEYLPEKYQQDQVLAYQREVHNTLIERGLEIISREYMQRLRHTCAHMEIPFREQVSDGKNAERLMTVAAEHDLIILGAQGIGKVDGSRGLGSTSRRVLRRTDRDILVTRNHKRPNRILIGLDGSDFSFRALDRGIGLGLSLPAEVRLAASHDPLLHRSIFRLLSRMLSEEAGKAFHFTEQEQLHNSIIDKGLADLYLGHLTRGRKIAFQNGLEKVSTELMEGPAWHSLCQRAEEWDADLIIVGRHGMHRGVSADIGATAERVAEESDTNVLVVGGEGRREKASIPPSSPPAYPTLTWSAEARERLERVPPFARPMAILAIERHALENGHSVITPELMDQARELFGT